MRDEPELDNNQSELTFDDQGWSEELPQVGVSHRSRGLHSDERLQNHFRIQVKHLLVNKYCRIVFRDKSVMLNDFWLKTISALKPKEQENQKNSRFLNRPIFNL